MFLYIFSVDFVVDLYGKFIDANRIEGDERMWSLKSLVSEKRLTNGKMLAKKATVCSCRQ
jgi:hypothetical protein